MYARVNTIFGSNEQLEAGIARVEGADRAAVEATSGNRGLTTMVDRAAAVIIAISYWDRPDRASAAGLTRARQDAVQAAGGGLVAENYTVVLDERASTPPPGSTVHLVRLQFGPDRGVGALAYLGEEILPPLRAVPGFCHAEVLVDHDQQAGMLVSTWRHHDDGRAGAVLDALRTDGPHRGHLGVPGIETYTLVRDAADTPADGPVTARVTAGL